MTPRARTWPTRRSSTGTGSWVAPVQGEDPPSRQRSVHQLAGSSHLGGIVRSSQLHITAHGVYEASINGTSVGDAELTPGR